MPFIKTGFAGLVVFEPVVYQDGRGYFFESYNERVFNQDGIDLRFVQDNQSRSSYGVVRGMHYQLNPHAQVKLVRVLNGRILDVALDIRKRSPTYSKWFSIELSAENKKQLFIPPGFAHGFAALSEGAEVSYKCNEFYDKASEGGICYNDPALAIDWGIPLDKIIVSEKDREYPVLAECKNNFEFGG